MPFADFRATKALKESGDRCDFAVCHLVCGAWQVWEEFALWKGKAPLLSAALGLLNPGHLDHLLDCENSLLVLSLHHHLPLFNAVDGGNPLKTTS